jgi:hypothetical protein
MHVAQNTKQQLIARHAMMLLAAVVLFTALATDALAAGDGGEGRAGGSGEFRGGNTGVGIAAPLLDSVPQMPPPVFNPSTPYTVPAPSETPVSPASPGSVFGND